MPPGGAADDAKGGCFLGAIGKEQEREGREAAGLHISRLWLGLMGCSRQTLLLPVLLVLADCRAQSSSTSTDWHGLTLYKGRVTELLFSQMYARMSMDKTGGHLLQGNLDEGCLAFCFP